MLSILLVSAAGALSRYFLEQFNSKTTPYFTLIANVTGSFIAGLALSKDTSTASLLIAFAGTFTTFSGLIRGVYQLESISRIRAFLYGHGTLALSLMAASLGLWIG